ncbi:hypothetical protein OSB04_017280 [Centaurea solstitialis]|uniref:pectinesterase n=1 Tax=Centaurea solstitialis TaxID=347529 RepID=A0AA38WI79_9ASTR|nr:hypothetical protein OSB04_017280 [Centaurea solstitialis]
MEASNSTNFLGQNTILIILLYTASTITFISALPKTNVEFIKSSCSFTTYPTLCVSSLSTRAGAIQTSPKLLAQTALSVTLDTTRSTSTAIVKLSKMHGMAPLEVAAMNDCIELLGDSVYELENSLKEMSRRGSKSSHLLISDLQTWVSAAMTNEDTCIEGFVNTKMKNVVRGKIVNVAHLTSNALALINSYANFCKQAVPPNNHEMLGDSVAWGGCTIIYLLGQQLHFELFDFSYQVLNIAEVNNTPQGWEVLLEAMKKARRLNNHVFSMLKARCPLEDKQACAIKQSGAPLHRIKFENTTSAFETLPQKCS